MRGGAGRAKVKGLLKGHEPGVPRCGAKLEGVLVVKNEVNQGYGVCGGKDAQCYLGDDLLDISHLFLALLWLVIRGVSSVACATCQPPASRRV